MVYVPTFFGNLWTGCGERQKPQPVWFLTGQLHAHIMPLEVITLSINKHEQYENQQNPVRFFAPGPVQTCRAAGPKRKPDFKRTHPRSSTPLRAEATGPYQLRFDCRSARCPGKRQKGGLGQADRTGNRRRGDRPPGGCKGPLVTTFGLPLCALSRKAPKRRLCTILPTGK